MARAWIGFFLLSMAAAHAQTPATMKQLMLDLIHPASNQILLIRESRRTRKRRRLGRCSS